MSAEAAQSLNRYPYVLNSPALYADPYGLLGCGPFGGLCEKAKDVGEEVGGGIKQGAEAVGGGIRRGAEAVGGGMARAADWTRDQVGRAASWLASCDWGKIGAGVLVIGGGAFVAFTGGYVAMGAAASASVATSGLGLYEGLEIATMTGMMGVTGGGIAGMGAFSMAKAGCGEDPSSGGGGDGKE